ncbi:hypothetical protein GCM10022393_18680 [Aquimarina addita]|uniref:Uncharacterized protein n=1 Tax=Aquimarina addita TaxID=870485 RepID=A0ABP6UIR2_9FLAO
MQKKKINKILIIAVALIWGVVTYKFAAPYFMTTDTVVTADVLVKPSQTFLRKKDTFRLTIPERDPFLGKIRREKKKVITTSSKPRKVSKVKSSKPWPKIEYLGFVKSKESTSRLGLLRVNGILKRVRNRSQVGDIIVKKISKDKISIQFQKEIKDFRK